MNPRNIPRDSFLGIYRGTRSSEFSEGSVPRKLPMKILRNISSELPRIGPSESPSKYPEEVLPRTKYPIKARNGSVFEPNKAPSVGLTLGLLDRPFGLWNSGCSDNSMKIQAKRNFRTAMVGSGQVLLDSDKTVELVG
ncbi:hypothetical protein F2Q69_00059990 [Brassica cretica]|uniref:Uncharacterized protein n=1 Tax=Brassica cretica TaxID=69181 RepID=A0A8S9RBS4_BRACR|nr:hypothetical protein F2Q69_00059990 [Brassica cretica]